MGIDNSLVPCRVDKPNPFEALFALIYMGVGAVCLIAGLRRMERWEILFGFAMLMVASQASNRFLARSGSTRLLGVLQAVGSHPGS